MSKSDLSTQERYQQILIHLHQSGQMWVEDLAMRLDVSSSTIRRDLTQMELQGLLPKIGISARARICGIDKIDLLITGVETSAEQASTFEQADVQVLRV